MNINNIVKKNSYRFIKYYREKYIKRNSNWLDNVDSNPERGYYLIREALLSDRPCMISRFGNNEIDATLCYKKGHPLSFMRTLFPFWVDETTKTRMKSNAGFFPNDNKHLARFADLIVDIASEIDILGVFNGYENNLSNIMHCEMIPLWQLEPFWSEKPWTTLLEGKHILVIHPFIDTICKQYQKRDLLFKKRNTLPEFASLQTIQAVQSIGGNKNGFNTWFNALQYMEEQIDGKSFDIALIGCGAYGMPLAAYCKRSGKHAIHMGGSLQLLFGIIGKRWENENFPQGKLMNEYWVRPSGNENIPNAQDVEDACYW